MNDKLTWNPFDFLLKYEPLLGQALLDYSNALEGLRQAEPADDKQQYWSALDEANVKIKIYTELIKDINGTMDKW